MTNSNQQQRLNEIVDKLNNLDLDPIKIKLMDTVEGEGWTREQADKVDILYRRFLYLNEKHQDQIIVPSKEVDKFWHTHILDTKKYQEDCMNIFGRFIHHFPYLGMRGEEDVKNLNDSFDATKELYLNEFGEQLISAFKGDIVANPCSDSPGNCWPASCNAKCNVKRQIDTIRPIFFENPTGSVDIFKGIPELVEV